MKIRRISAAALAAVMMTGTAVTAFAEDEINADFKAKVDDLAAKTAVLEEKANGLKDKYGEEISSLPEDQQEAAMNEIMGLFAEVLELVEPIKEIQDMKDTLNEAEKAYAEEKLPGIFDEDSDLTSGLGLSADDLDTALKTSDTDSADTNSAAAGTSAPAASGSSDNSDTGVGGIAVLAGTVALAGAALVIARKKK